jgi:hypothetical protein
MQKIKFYLDYFPLKREELTIMYSVFMEKNYIFKDKTGIPKSYKSQYFKMKLGTSLSFAEAFINWYPIKYVYQTLLYKNVKCLIPLQVVLGISQM